VSRTCVCVIPLIHVALAFRYPYVLAFEPTFVEIHNVETGSMSQVIQGNNLRCLITDTCPRYNGPTHACRAARFRLIIVVPAWVRTRMDSSTPDCYPRRQCILVNCSSSRRHRRLMDGVWVAVRRLYWCRMIMC
jgi:hypothetical protein